MKPLKKDKNSAGLQPSSGMDQKALITKLQRQLQQKEQKIRSLEETIKRIQNESDTAKQLSSEYNAHLNIMASAIAHELRTPLTSVRAALNGFKNYLAPLYEGYELARDHRLTDKEIPLARYQTLKVIPDTVDKELRDANTIIDMFLMNIRHQEHVIEKESFTTVSVKDVVNNAISRYPFTSPEQVSLIHFDDSYSDIIFHGSEILAIHVLFNLLKNALYYINKEQKGEITIRIIGNNLYFKDTAKGMSETVKDNLFTRYYSTQPEGTGIGLVFCKIVMRSFGGDIRCRSVEGEFTEFILNFPGN